MARLYFLVVFAWCAFHLLVVSAGAFHYWPNLLSAAPWLRVYGEATSANTSYAFFVDASTVTLTCFRARDASRRFQLSLHGFTGRADRYQKCEIARLHAEDPWLKAELLRTNGEQRVRLTPEQHERLNKLRKTIDPERLKQIDVLFDAE
jgi:hypothetical protein